MQAPSASGHPLGKELAVLLGDADADDGKYEGHNDGDHACHAGDAGDDEGADIPDAYTHASPTFLSSLIARRLHPQQTPRPYWP